MTTKTTKAAPAANPAETPVTLEQVSPAMQVTTNMTVVDNTDAKPVEEKPVDTEEYELLNGMTQVNYL